MNEAGQGWRACSPVTGVGWERTGIQRCSRGMPARRGGPGQTARAESPGHTAWRRAGPALLGTRVGLAVAGLESVDRDVGVDLGGRGRGVAEDLLNAAQVG